MKDILFGIWLVTVKIISLTEGKWIVHNIVSTKSGSRMPISHPLNTPQMLDDLEKYLAAIADDFNNERHDFSVQVPANYRSLVPNDYNYEDMADKAAAMYDDSELAGSPISMERVDWNDDELMKTWDRGIRY